MMTEQNWNVETVTVSRDDGSEYTIQRYSRNDVPNVKVYGAPPRVDDFALGYSDLDNWA